MSSQRHSRTQRPGPGLANGAVRWLLLLLFVGQVIHLTTHLAEDAHHDLWHANAPQVPHGQPLAHADNSHHEHDCHPPHSSTEHLIQRPHKSVHSHLDVDLVLVETFLLLPPPPPRIVVLPDKAELAPAEAPPDPRQPRAPPLA